MRTGRPKLQFCKNGHDTFITGKYSDGSCVECKKERNYKEYRENIEKVKARNRKIYYDNIEKYKKNHDQWLKDNPEKIKEHGWKRYGIKNSNGSPFITIDFDRLYQIQQGKCVICGEHQSKLKHTFHVDHDHKTGIVRSLLCSSCNKMLGFAKDSKEYLQAGIEYLIRFEDIKGDY